MGGRAFIAMWLACVATCAGAGDAGSPSVRPAECTAPIGAIGAVRGKLDGGRKLLSDDEADCAFVAFTNGGLSARCAQIKARANPTAKRAWSEMQTGWDELGRLRLDLRKLEDRLGIECEPE
jgi:hypothetical protein